MSDEKAKILKINDVFKLNLSIPDYQRPYKWTVENVQQLLEDLLYHFDENQKPYRIGTLITHKNVEYNDIVDGQQRITTLFLILYCLRSDFRKNIKLNYKHSISYNNIIINKNFINEFISENLSGKQDLYYDYILNKCEVVHVELTDLDEAFQFFDSQNSRGKSLQAYDLLKAFHLGAVSNEDDEQINYVEKWEKSISNKALDKKGDLYFIIGLMLFRLRRWLRYQNGFNFNRKDINVFKGVDNNVDYPYLHSIKASQDLSNKKESTIGYFYIPQTIINGGLFFHYIEHYLKLYNDLFDYDSGILKRIDVKNTNVLNKNILDFIYYDKHRRTGDTYVRNLFQSIVLYYYDRFGDNHLDAAVLKILKWTYKIRIKNSSVRVETIENAAQSQMGILHYIDQMVHSKEILKYRVEIEEKDKIRKDIENLNLFFDIKEDLMHEKQ
jgi:hypothetical protein